MCQYSSAEDSDMTNRNADFLDQIGERRHSCQSREEPAVPQLPLSDRVGIGRPSGGIEMRFVEYLGDTLDVLTRRLHEARQAVQAQETIEFEVKLDIP